MYQKINWVNHIVEYPLRRIISDNQDGTYTVQPSPGEIIQRGTKQSAENFNHMDDGIFDTCLANQIFFQNMILNLNTSNINLMEADKQDIQSIVGQIWAKPFEPEKPEFATESDVKNLFK